MDLEQSSHIVSKMALSFLIYLDGLSNKLKQQIMHACSKIRTGVIKGKRHKKEPKSAGY